MNESKSLSIQVRYTVTNLELSVVKAMSEAGVAGTVVSVMFRHPL
jgi:hypothetical protein